MNFIILGTGGIGAFYGAKLVLAGHSVKFIARGEHLKVLKEKGLSLTHSTFAFNEKIDVCSFEDLDFKVIQESDAIIFSTKSTSTKELAQKLNTVINQNLSFPYLVSLQNGVENEDILCEYFPEEKVIGGLSRKIGAHIIEAGVIESTGDVETIIGAIKENNLNKSFMEDFKYSLEKVETKCEIVSDIKLELWKKLIINNGVNAICALLRVKTGIVMRNEKLSQIVYGLMKETAIAAKVDNIEISPKDVEQMFELIKHFDSIKPSMLVDVENGRVIEIDEICNIVIKKCEQLDYDASYTKTISYLLDFIYYN
ncbi:2-dehydropantoate 2-reductase [Halarcobacter sp.]|uniref:ketopantoate reductase family protein n=1 Tax=Halarcobacter sp. TaxID=2321133 RepID=UPI0029F54B96|nr:2-dehydropantoate 2-reductase [Halarcobacter sp.]